MKKHGAPPKLLNYWFIYLLWTSCWIALRGPPGIYVYVCEVYLELCEWKKHGAPPKLLNYWFIYLLWTSCWIALRGPPGIYVYVCVKCTSSYVNEETWCPTQTTPLLTHILTVNKLLNSPAGTTWNICICVCEVYLEFCEWRNMVSQTRCLASLTPDNLEVIWMTSRWLQQRTISFILQN